MRAVVKSPICPLFSKPRRDCERVDEALFGMVVEVLSQSNQRFWKVRTRYRYEGYAPATCLVLSDAVSDHWETLPKKVVLHKNTCDVMAEPKVQSWSRVTLPTGAVVAVEGEPEKGWQKVLLPTGNPGYMRASWLDTYYTSPIDLPEAQLRQRLVDTAMLYLRTHYRWGGKTPMGIDCSGLASMSYLLNGIIIYRDAHIEEHFPIHAIPRERMKPGDLMFFPGHVAMYMGDDRYIHSTGRAGSDGVVINSLDPNDPDYREDLPKILTTVGSYF